MYSIDFDTPRRIRQQFTSSNVHQKGVKRVTGWSIDQPCLEFFSRIRMLLESYLFTCYENERVFDRYRQMSEFFQK